RARGAAAVLWAARQADGASRGQRLCFQDRKGHIALRRRSLLRTVLRPFPAARPDILWLGRAGRTERHHRHQALCHQNSGRVSDQCLGRSQPRAQSAWSSGVLVEPSGMIVTNFRVIKNADEVKVATSDGREFASKILLKDETLDLAVLKIESDKPFPTVPIGDSDALQVGDLVLAIGNPFGVGQTTTSGIVSALARTHIGISDSGFFIQTDAAINPGNSGGALINMAGQLVGINTAIFSRSGGSIGIGFAIPSNMVRAVTQAAASGADFFERPYLGANFEEVTAQIAESLGMPRPTGALVSSVVAEGPAGKAGLKPGDVVLTMNGAPIEHSDALSYRLATQSVGAKAELE